jgi:hypothetical protein
MEQEGYEISILTPTKNLGLATISSLARPGRMEDVYPSPENVVATFQTG